MPTSKASPHIWDRAGQLRLKRDCPGHPHYSADFLDGGVIYSILQLERLGAKTFFSCEGHPSGFYIVLECEEALARRIHQAGFFSIGIENGPNRWSLRLDPLSTSTEAERRRSLRWAADAWERHLGALDFAGAA
jgi:hypothetical protein